MKEKGAQQLLQYDTEKKQTKEIESHIHQVEKAKEEVKTDLDKQKERMMQRLAQRKQKLAENRSMSLNIGQVPFRNNFSKSGGETSFMSGGRSLGGGLANRMYCALSRVNYASSGE